MPYLGDIPYAGGLFRNTYWSDKETDLVMSVTPEIVAAAAPGRAGVPADGRSELTPERNQKPGASIRRTPPGRVLASPQEN